MESHTGAGRRRPHLHPPGSPSLPFRPEDPPVDPGALDLPARSRRKSPRRMCVELGSLSYVERMMFPDPGGSGDRRGSPVRTATERGTSGLRPLACPAGPCGRVPAAHAGGCSGSGGVGAPARPPRNDSELDTFLFLLDRARLVVGVLPAPDEDGFVLVPARVAVGPRTRTSPSASRSCRSTRSSGSGRTCRSGGRQAAGSGRPSPPPLRWRGRGRPSRQPSVT